MIISIFTPHGGCPERCHFCDQSVSGGEAVAASQITETIEAHLRTGGRAEEIAFYGGTFTAIPKARQIAYLDAALPYLKNGEIDSVRVATRPDALEAEWLTHLRDEYRLKTVELGVQSFNPSVLQALGRSHSVASVESAVLLLHSLGLRAGLHLMIGCPEESENDDALSLEWLAKLRPALVRIHPLLVLKGTELEERWRAGLFQPLTLEGAVARAATLVEGIEALGLKVIRLGLQPNTLLGEAVVAGPFHPGFGDIVRRRIRGVA